MKIERTIKAEPRKRTGSGVLKQMRREGWVPSVIYGADKDNLNIKIHAKTFFDLMKTAPSSKILINVETEAGVQPCFIQDLQYDALTGSILHADFLAVNDDTELRASLPLVLTGTAVGEKIGGQLEQMVHKLAIRCKVKHLPETIDTDITKLNLSETHRIGNIEFPEGVVPTLNEKVVVALVAKTRAAKSAGGDGDTADASETATAGA